MKCPICKKRVIKGRKYADRRHKLQKVDGRPRLIHTGQCLDVFLVTKRILTSQGIFEWQGISLIDRAVIPPRFIDELFNMSHYQRLMFEKYGKGTR